MAALFGIAEAHLQAQTPDKGDDVLEDFIEHHPQEIELDRIFAKLDELYRAERKPSRGELERWIRDPAEPRRGFARWYLARLEMRLGHNDRAAESFAALAAAKPTSPKLAPARWILRNCSFNRSNLSAPWLFSTRRARYSLFRRYYSGPDFLAAQTQYARKNFTAAATSFSELSTSPSSFREIAGFNAALGWLQVAEHGGGGNNNYRELIQKVDGKTSAELQLDAALLQATDHEPESLRGAEKFYPRFPARSPGIGGASRSSRTRFPRFTAKNRGSAQICQRNKIILRRSPQSVAMI